MTIENPDYGLTKQASIIIESTPLKRFSLLQRSRGSHNLYADIPSAFDEDEDDLYGTTRVHNYISRAISMTEHDDHEGGDRREAWRRVLSFAEIDQT